MSVKPVAIQGICSETKHEDGITFMLLLFIKLLQPVVSIVMILLEFWKQR
ncbi:MAG: hypothetical protein E6750_20115 [Atlantibacter hermannii]|nr:hypothetical protein [Atlantibacter hermannii]MDU1953688.1 hypothetical protein [Atlantibacter hermannii]